MPQFDDDLFLGTAYAGGAGPATLNPDGSDYSEPSPMAGGVGPLGRVYIFDLVPAAAAVGAIVNAAAVAAAGNATLAAAAPISLDRTGRCLRFVSSAAGDTTQVVTVRGFDMYGQPMTETRTLNGTTVVNGLKAFWRVQSVSVSAAMAGTLSVGTRDVFGLPVRVNDAGYVISAKWDGALADNAGTLVVADGATATGTTGDVRGTFAQAGNAANGTRRLVIAIGLTALACGPNATRAGAFGVPQFAG